MKQVDPETRILFLTYYCKENKRRRGTVLRKIISILSCVIIILAGAGWYSWKAGYYGTHFLNGTEINGKDVSGMTAGQANKLLDRSSNYVLKIHGRDGLMEEISGEDIGMKADMLEGLEKILQGQNRWKWLTPAGKDYKVPAIYTSNEELADAVVNGLSCMSGAGTEPMDAYLATEPDGTRIIVPEVEGTLVDREKASSVILDALNKRKTDADLDAEGCYIAPSVRSTDTLLVKRAGKWNALVGMSVICKFPDGDEVIPGSQIAGHITDDGQDVVLDTGSWVSALVTEWAGRHTKAVGAYEVETADGGTALVKAQGNQEAVLNVEKTAAIACEMLVSGQDGDFEPVWEDPAGAPGDGDNSNVRIEASIDSQKLYLFSGGEKIYETDIVSGKIGAGETVRGVYEVSAVESPGAVSVLDTRNNGSSTSYKIIFNGGQSIIAAPWRTEFGGTIYVSDGTHGNIDIPEEAAAFIFQHVSTGAQVIIY